MSVNDSRSSVQETKREKLAYIITHFKTSSQYSIVPRIDCPVCFDILILITQSPYQLIFFFFRFCLEPFI